MHFVVMFDFENLSRFICVEIETFANQILATSRSILL
jgi:hypothetical protein